jgi:hypothetical protein
MLAGEPLPADKYNPPEHGVTVNREHLVADLAGLPSRAICAAAKTL